MIPWNTLAAAEPRLLDVLHAAITDMIHGEESAEMIYCASKRLLDHLVGWHRGHQPEPPHHYAGDALRRLHAQAAPFDVPPGDWLATSDAYQAAVAHVHDRLADLESPCPSCTSYQPAYGRRRTTTLHRCAPCNARWAVHHLQEIR